MVWKHETGRGHVGQPGRPTGFAFSDTRSASSSSWRGVAQQRPVLTRDYEAWAYTRAGGKWIDDATNAKGLAAPLPVAPRRPGPEGERLRPVAEAVSDPWPRGAHGSSVRESALWQMGSLTMSLD